MAEACATKTRKGLAFAGQLDLHGHSHLDLAHIVGLTDDRHIDRMRGPDLDRRDPNVVFCRKLVLLGDLAGGMDGDDVTFPEPRRRLSGV